MPVSLTYLRSSFRCSLLLIIVWEIRKITICSETKQNILYGEWDCWFVERPDQVLIVFFLWLKISSHIHNISFDSDKKYKLILNNIRWSKSLHIKPSHFYLPPVPHSLQKRSYWFSKSYPCLMLSLSGICNNFIKM